MTYIKSTNSKKNNNNKQAYKDILSGHLLLAKVCNCNSTGAIAFCHFFFFSFFLEGAGSFLLT